jgi:hypothetical protein
MPAKGLPLLASARNSMCEASPSLELRVAARPVKVKLVEFLSSGAT